MMAAGNALSVEAKLDDKGVLTGVKQMKGELEGAAVAAQKSNDGYTTMKNVLANLATQGIGMAYNAVKDFCSEIVTIGSTFETSMSKVSALSGATGDDLAALEAKARELGASTTFSASEAADALGYMALAGWDTQQMLEGVGSVLTLAQAGEMDLAAASDLVTDYLSAFNMTAAETQRMVDVLAYAQANANTDVEGLGMAFKNCAANCNAAGLDIETTSSLIAQMANQGLKGQLAGTALNAVMRDMTNQMKDGAIAIGENSVQIMDAEGNYRDFMDILSDIEGATNGMGDAQKAAALQTTFTADSIKGLNLLLNAGSSEASAFRDELYNCAGTAQATADTMTDNLGGDLAAMRSALEETAIKVYESLQEPLRSAAQFMTNTVIPAITVLIENFDKIAPVLGGIATGLLVLATRQKVASTVSAAFKKATDTLTASHLKFKTVTSAAGTTLIQYNAQTKAITTSMHASTAAAKLQAMQIRASEAAMKLGAAAARTLGSALKAIAPMAAMTALIEVATMIGGAMEDAAEHERAFDKATKGITESMSSFDKAASEAAKSVAGSAEASEGATEAYASNTRSIQECLEATGQLADKMSEAWAEVGTNAGLVDAYAQKIADLSEKESLTADEQAELVSSVEAFNELTGSSVGVINAQTGELNTNAEAILKTAEAYKEQARAEAARELMKENAKELIQNEIALRQAKEDLTRAQETLNNETDPSLWAQYSYQVEQAQSKFDELNSVVESQKQAQSDLIGAISDAPASFETLQGALESCGLSMDSFAGASEEQMAALQGSFDGSLNSIVSACASQGMQIPTALADSIRANMGLAGDAQQVMFDAMVLKMTGGSVPDAAKVLGHDIDQGLMDGILGNGDMPAEAIGLMSEDVIARAKETFDSNSPSLVMDQLGNDIDAGLGNGINGGAEGPASAMSALGATVLAGIQNLPGQATSTGTSAGDNLASGINSATSKVSGAAGRIANSALSGVEVSKDSFTKAGKSAVDGFGNTIGQADAYNQARALATTAERGLGTARGDTAGVQFGQGYGLGMQSQGSYVYQMAYRLGEQAIQGVKDAQRSASPSKVARGLGGDYGQGYGLGIEDEYDFVERKGAGLVEAALSKPVYPTLGIDWFGAKGKFNSASLLGASIPVAEPMLVEAQSESTDQLLRELIDELSALRRDLPVLFATFCMRTLELNDREFARLVKEALD